MDHYWDNVVFHFRDFLRDWYEVLYDRKLRDFSDLSYHRIASLYGRDVLIQRFEDEMAQYEIDDIFVGGNRPPSPGYAAALDEDEETPEGRLFGLANLERWGAVDNLFHLKKTGERRIKRFNSTELRYDVEIASLPSVLSPEESITALPTILEKVFELCTDKFNQDDRVVIGLECATLDQGGIYLSMRRLSDFSVEALMQKVALLNSQKKLCVDNSFRIRIFRTEIPRGGTNKRKYVHVARDRKRLAKSFVTVGVEKNLCLPAALVLGKFRLTHDITKGMGTAYSKWKSLTHLQRPQNLERMALQVLEESGLPIGHKMNLDDLEILQRTCFPEFQVKVVSSDCGNVVVACIPEEKEPEMQIIYLLLDRDHFDLITSPSGFFRNSYFCDTCNKPFEDKTDHRCGGVCRQCNRFREECEDTQRQKCSECLRTFNNPTCFDLHLRTRKNGNIPCNEIFVCKKCKVFVNLQNRKQKKPKHHCGEKYCRVCGDFFQSGHQCYIRKVEMKKPLEVPNHIYFDYETYETVEGHQPSMIIAQYPDGQEFRFPPDGTPMENPEEIARSFGEWLFREEHRDHTILALNLRSYDGHFVLKHMLDNNMKGVKIIKRGNQLLDIQYPALGINARDTLNFVASSLSNFPKTVGLNDLTVQKGDFPHRTNKPENWDKIIPFPEVDQYFIEKLVKTKRDEFIRWHAEEKERCGGIFDFRTQMANYCSNDVTVLRKCVLKFRSDFITLTGTDPFESVTIASACHKYYRHAMLKPQTLAVISGHGYQANRKTSHEATQWLEWENMSADGRIQHGRTGKEEKIGSYFVDGIDLQTKTIYEYNGCVFHGHPECTEEDDRIPFGNLTMREAYEAWETRVEFLRNLNFTVEVKWSCEWLKERKDPDISQFLTNLNLREPLAPRDAFKGGRTNAARLFYETKPGEKILHYDIVSLYPTVNKLDEYPIDHPEIIVNPTDDIRNYYGFVYCKVQPPKRLRYPVLPMTINDKLMFVLCKTCAKDNYQKICRHKPDERALEAVWTTPELHRALDRGYVIDEIYEVWHWKNRMKGLFATYVNHFLNEKIEASGWPRWCRR